MSFRVERLLSYPLAALLAGQFVLLGALWPVLPINPDISMRYAILAVILAFVLNILFGSRGGSRILVLGLVFALATALIPIIVKGYDSFLLITLLSAILGYLTYRYTPPSALVLWVFGVLCTYLFVYYLLHGQLNDVFYYSDSDVARGVSRNYIGILLLQQYLVYYALCVRTRTCPQHWPLFLMPIVGVMTSGVGSTLVATLALFGYLFHRLALRPAHGILLLFALLAATSMLAGWFVNTELFERLISGEFVGSRVLLWADFATKLNAKTLWFGFPKGAGFVDHAVSLNEINNLHNSYLNLFVRTGIFSLSYLLLVCYTAVALVRSHHMLGWLFICALLRGATDGYFFSTFLIDFILIFLFLLTPIGARLMNVSMTSQMPLRL